VVLIVVLVLQWLIFLQNEREQRENLPLPYSPVSPLARDVEAQEPENELGDDMDISNIWN